MLRRWQMARPIRIITNPTATHPDARNIYSLTIGEYYYRLWFAVAQIFLVQMSFMGFLVGVTYPPDLLPLGIGEGKGESIHVCRLTFISSVC